MNPRFASTLIWLLSFVSVAVIGAATAHAQSFLGPNECTDCHDHKDELEWSRKLDGDGDKKQHFNARNQLRDARSVEWAKAIGLDNVFDIKGRCVECHATVVRGKDRFGITCESCHGPGSDYLEVHKEPKGVGYAKAIKVGMKDLSDKPETWARDCLTCHVLGNDKSDALLAKAGHPTGFDFNIAVKFRPVALHWTPPKGKYTENQVNATATPVYSGLVAKLKSALGSATPPPPPPAPSSDPPTPPPAGPTTSAPPTTTAPPAGPTPAPPTTATPPTTAPPVAGPRPPARTGPSLPPPRPPAGPVVQGPANTVTPVTPPPQEPTLPRSPAGIVAAIQGRLASILDALLTKGVTTPVPPPPPANTYRGADADLLRLQQEVIALALEALGTKPAETAKPKP